MLAYSTILKLGDHVTQPQLSFFELQERMSKCTDEDNVLRKRLLQITLFNPGLSIYFIYHIFTVTKNQYNIA